MSEANLRPEPVTKQKNGSLVAWCNKSQIPEAGAGAKGKLFISGAIGPGRGADSPLKDPISFSAEDQGSYRYREERDFFLSNYLARFW